MASKKYIYALWKRKTAVAQVKLFEWEGQSMINGKNYQDYVSRWDLYSVLLSPLKLVSWEGKYYFEVNVVGSGESAQVQAIRHGLARALSRVDAAMKKTMKQNHLLTRDARKVERKKPGLHKARKATQWSKR
jgi:small subunit ribosomal protein S9